MRKSSYKDVEKYKKIVKEQKSRYYAKTQNAKNSRERWSPEEIELILKHEISDTELSERLGRSVGAIQAMRCLVKKKKRENEKNSFFRRFFSLETIEKSKKKCYIYNEVLGGEKYFYFF